jgi:hypothetical protein
MLIGLKSEDLARAAEGLDGCAAGGDADRDQASACRQLASALRVEIRRRKRDAPRERAWLINHLLLGLWFLAWSAATVIGVAWDGQYALWSVPAMVLGTAALWMWHDRGGRVI